MRDNIDFKFKYRFLTPLIIILLSLLIIRYLFLYIDYKRLKSANIYYDDAKVVNIYNKGDKSLLKLKSSNLTIFTYSKYKAKISEWIRIKYKTKNLNFISYLRSYFTDAKILEHIEYGLDRTKALRDYINSIHKNSNIASFYNAIFFAKTLNKELREKINALGISHLVAISGFHLSVLWGVIFTIVVLPYKFFQKRYFPWRNRIVDISVVALIFLAIYTLFVGSPPALIRSYFMLLIIAIFIVLGVEILSFELLILAFLFILLIFPKLIVSLSFWLSIGGVFYIFLILRYFGKLKAWIIAIFLVPIGLFIFIYPISHLFFGEVNIYQLLSPILSLIFIPFYPLTIVLHIVGFGDVFDRYLEYIFNLPTYSSYKYTNIWAGMLYILISIFAIFNKIVFLFAFVFALVLTIELFLR